MVSMWALAGGARSPAAAARLIAHAVFPLQVVAGEVDRLVTGAWLHESWLHLGVNAVALLFAGRLVEGLYGAAGLWLVFGASLLGGGIGTIASGVTLSVGASGGVFGLLGAMMVSGLRIGRHLDDRGRRLLIAVPGAALGAATLRELLGLSDGGATTDLGAHVAGAITGAAVAWPMGGALARRLDDVGSARRRGSSPLVRAAAVAVAVTHLTGVGLAAVRPRLPIKLPQASVTWVETAQGRAPTPGGYDVGVWRGGTCDGKATPVRWALQTERIPCFRLPLGGWLLLGRRDALLTMDDKDIETMREANRRRGLVRRQPGIMLFPVGSELLYVLVAVEPLHTVYNEALTDLLRAAAPATIGPARPQEPVISKPTSST